MILTDELFYIDPSKWGRAFWKSINSIAVTYDPMDSQNREYLAQYLTSLQHLLPCGTCREHYRQYLDTYPIQNELDTRISLLAWIFRLRSEINHRNNQKNITFQKYVRHLEKDFDISLIKK